MTGELFIILNWLFVGYYSMFLVLYFAKLEPDNNISMKRLFLEPFQYCILGPIISVLIIIMSILHLNNILKEDDLC